MTRKYTSPISDFCFDLDNRGKGNFPIKDICFPEDIKPKYVLSVNDFCFAHCISRNTFYALLRSGNGPEILRINRRTLITLEAAEKWRNEHSK